jgi:carbon-monoxide dehydrogenase large subunit
VLRKEDRRLLMGRGKYAADFRAPGMLHAALLRSPHAHARLGAVRTDKALGLPGVVSVVTAGDLGDIGRIPTRLGHRIGNVACLPRPLARDRVRYVGEPIALVIAESRYVARAAETRTRLVLLPTSRTRHGGPGCASHPFTPPAPQPCTR